MKPEILKNKRRVDAVIKMIGDLDPFYAIRIERYDATLQGDYSSALDRKVRKLGFKRVESSDYMHYKRSNIRIVLT